MRPRAVGKQGFINPLIYSVWPKALPNIALLDFTIFRVLWIFAQMEHKHLNFSGSNPGLVPSYASGKERISVAQAFSLKERRCRVGIPGVEFPLLPFLGGSLGSRKILAWQEQLYWAGGPSDC